MFIVERVSRSRLPGSGTLSIVLLVFRNQVLGLAAATWDFKVSPINDLPSFLMEPLDAFFCLASIAVAESNAMNLFSFSMILNLPSSPACIRDDEVSFFTAELFTFPAPLLLPPHNWPHKKVQLQLFKRSIRI